MKFLRKTHKAVALFFLINFGFQIFAPAVSYALTSGPTAPEATSFEPVDTTDLVNLQTGDFVYNIPLLEVPGPAGSYPLSLSYHAGIQPDQEASWVGLGFTLNPGAISRLVNGYPDDQRLATNTDRTYWKGGETTTQTYGLSYGIANAVSVSASLTFAQDTYRGYGVGAYAGVGVGIGGQNSPYSLNAGVRTNPYGGMSYSLGLSAGVGGAVHASAGFGYDSDAGFGVSGGVGLRTGRISLLGASISSNQSSASLSVAGYVSGVNNSRSGNISTYSDNFSIDIPVVVIPGLNIQLGRSYQRYWIDETVNVATIGSLNMSGFSPGFDYAFDTYSLLDTDLDVATFNNPEKVLGGSFPDYDQYTVTAQGIGGNIQPYLFQKTLYRQDKKQLEGGKDVVYSRNYRLNLVAELDPVEFRFLNDFSNRYEYTPPDFRIINNDDLSFGFHKPVTGKNEQDGFVNNKLAGSKDIYWYTNAQITGSDQATKKPFLEGFIDTDSEGFNREVNSQVGGFSITNSSGVTYHYALPAYSFNEYMKSRRFDDKNVEWFNELKKPEKYAYTWFLTAVTGPDYVDRNLNGKLDKSDYGYWINFTYKKWLKDYQWRNPAEGFNKDIDGEFESFSYGNKEIYYLERISSPSHVAVFEKSERLDSREVSSLIDGGFGPLLSPRDVCRKACTPVRNCGPGGCTVSGPSPTCLANCDKLSDVKPLPRPLLKLNRIKLYNAEDYNLGRTTDNSILRAIEFNYDYLLTKGTPNSFNQASPTVKLGKLTLTSLNFLGKGGSSLLPPTSFIYDKNPDYKKNARDMWGFFKSDYEDLSNENLSRLTSVASSLNVDAWSLTSIANTLGSKIRINYESDSYDKPVLAKQKVLRIKNVTDLNGTLKIDFWEPGISLDNYFSIGNTINVDLAGAYYRYDASSIRCTPSATIEPRTYDLILFSNIMKIESIDLSSGSLIVSNSDFYNYLKYSRKELTRRFVFQEKLVHDCRVIYENDQSWPDYFPAGFVSFPYDKQTFGGGVRVTSIALESDARINKTHYEYFNGVTSYEPFGILPAVINPDYAKLAQPDGTKLLIKKALLPIYSELLNVSRSLPGPGVMYEKIKVSESVVEMGVENYLPNHSVYEFEVYSKGMVDFVKKKSYSTGINGADEDGLDYTDINTANVTLKDYSSRVGNLKSVSLINSADSKIISKTENKYLHDGLDGSFTQNTTQYEAKLKSDFANQGLVEETFAKASITLYRIGEHKPYFDRGRDYFEKDERNLMGTITKRETFPSIQIGQVSTNYKTGIKTETQNLAFDFYSGDVIKTLTTDAYGNRFISESVPAYNVYPGMGLRINGSTNKHMLSQIASTLSYKVDASNTPIGLLSASVQTWSDKVPVLGLSSPQLGIWRKEASYQWNGQQTLNGDGSYPIADFNANPFNRPNPASNANWQNSGSITLYDIYSHGLEATDINGNYVSTRMDPKQVRVIASTVNSSYDESVYSGIESSSGNAVEEGGVNRGSGNPSISFAHTGKYGLATGVNSRGFNYTLKAVAAKNYRASVWVYAPGTSETQSELDKIQLRITDKNGVVKKEIHPTLQKSKSKSWYLLNVDFNRAIGEELIVDCKNGANRTVYFDDFRVHPVNASMTSYVYDAFSGELTHLLDANNFYTKFEYDAMGRLVRTSKELLNFDFGPAKESFRADVILSETVYNYKLKPLKK